MPVRSSGPSKSELPIPRERFDPWNSVSTGHQKDGSNRLAGSTSWRQSRTAKLAAQFRGGLGGGRRVVDAVGAGRPDGGWQAGADGLQRVTGCADVREMLKNSGSKVTKPGTRLATKSSAGQDHTQREGSTKRRHEDDAAQPSGGTDQRKRSRKVFDGLCFYINGSTAPTVSDHRLKHLIAENGGQVAIGLARKTVTHVVLGAPRDASCPSGGTSNNGGHGRCGGGLSAAKLQNEVRRIGGQPVKYVTAEWVLASLNSGRRAPDSTGLAQPLRFTSSSAQKTLTGMFGKPSVST